MGSAWCLQQGQRQQQPAPSARAQTQQRCAAGCGAAPSLLWEASAWCNLAGLDSAVPSKAPCSAAPCPGSARGCARSAPAPLASRGVALQAPPAPLPAPSCWDTSGAGEEPALFGEGSASRSQAGLPVSLPAGSWPGTIFTVGGDASKGPGGAERVEIGHGAHTARRPPR